MQAAGVDAANPERLNLPILSRHFAGQKGQTMAKRTTHRSTKGKKLYAVRDKEGRFKDIQTYKRAHSQDIKRKSKAEAGKTTTKAKKAKKKK
ncbi:MAG: hypothetical protein GHHEDOFH_03031 [Pseudorhodoplanes sp.]|nr:hypothetical protein [Pseudorhodoplanes sp.]